MFLTFKKVSSDVYELTQKLPKSTQYWYYDMTNKLSSTTGSKDEIPTQTMTDACYDSLKHRFQLK